MSVFIYHYKLYCCLFSFSFFERKLNTYLTCIYIYVSWNILILQKIFLTVQVYTVGMDYQHAEARKSPVLDGKVERDQDGKEIRYPVLLSAREKLIARKVCQAFKVINDSYK